MITSDCPVGARKRRRHRFALAGVAVSLVAAAGGLAARMLGREPAARVRYETGVPMARTPMPASDPSSQFAPAPTP